MDEKNYQRMIEQFDETRANEIREKNAWRKACLLSLSFLIISITGWFYVSTLPKAVPHVIQVSDWGEAQYIGPVGENAFAGYTPSKASIIYYLRDWFKNIRSVSTDSTILEKNLLKSFNFVTQNASAKLRKNLLEEDPFQIGLNQRREIFFESLIQVSEQSWQIDWIEKTFDASDGDQVDEKRYRGVVSLYLGEPEEEQRIFNPLGIYIDEFEFVEIIKNNKE